ncbi:hypothetical protein EYF80_063132 [Liparis tanakae]|uniref:Uncharacterized protein n=1 Tax=Liparis tanakae TaxID=230148 RepID=A0A4Z2EDV0_9TELE|nr:hypothetical protein EYF80_063132 [Liparis tanakae]
MSHAQQPRAHEGGTTHPRRPVHGLLYNQRSPLLCCVSGGEDEDERGEDEDERGEDETWR